MTEDRDSWAAFREMAKEEFWIVFGSFFAPIYGTVIVLRHLLKVANGVDRGRAGLTHSTQDRWSIPAE